MAAKAKIKVKKRRKTEYIDRKSVQSKEATEIKSGKNKGGAKVNLKGGGKAIISKRLRKELGI
jgi:23S rRNA pseudoU1915 N3-methylase RlmH